MDYQRKMGQYFTPEFIASFMVKRSLNPFLDTLKNQLLKNLSKKEINFLFETIRNYKILDPALGEGIFLEMALRELIDFYYFFNKEQEFIKVENPALFALKNNIFGVEFDLNALSRARRRLRSYCDDDKNNIEFHLKLGNSLKWPTINKFSNNIELEIEQNMEDGDNFFWESEFPKVFLSQKTKKKRGFDLIIGNPPYIRIHKQDKELKKFIRKYYETPMKDFDLYIIFIELCIKLLKNNGSLCLITSDKFLTRIYAKKLRQFILEHLFFTEIFDISRCKNSFNVDAYPIIFIAQKKSRSSFDNASIENKKDYFSFYQIYENLQETLLNILNGRYQSREKISQNQFLKNENYEFYLHSRKLSAILGELNSFEKLGDILDKQDFFCGTPRAKDYHSWNKFIVDGEEQIPQDTEYLKYIVCRNIKPFLINWGIKINSVRNTYYRPYFIYKRNEMSESRWKKFKKRPKILVRGNDTRITAALDQEGHVCNGIYGIIQDKIKPKILLVLLNSEILNFFFMLKNPSVKISGNFYSINSMHLKNLPINYDLIKNNNELLTLATEIIRARKLVKKIASNDDKYELYKELYLRINDLCYEIYGMSEKKKNEIKDFLKDSSIVNFHL
ncbi:MAG: Eco57I restriction-modification methylase domain-containing protein [Candidatus Helarchaeota archaeon]